MLTVGIIEMDGSLCRPEEREELEKDALTTGRDLENENVRTGNCVWPRLECELKSLCEHHEHE